jgi:hypothetical protein
MANELPIAQCELDGAGLAAQRDRYARLAAAVDGLDRRPGQLVVRFGPDVDTTLVEETLAVERSCCPFFRLAFDASARRLEIRVDRSDEDPALDALQFALATAAGHPDAG